MLFRTPAAGAVAGDFADIAFWVLKGRCSTSGNNYSIKDINRHLDNLADIHAKSTPGKF